MLKEGRKELIRAGETHHGNDLPDQVFSGLYGCFYIKIKAIKPKNLYFPAHTHSVCMYVIYVQVYK